MQILWFLFSDSYDLHISPKSIEERLSPNNSILTTAKTIEFTRKSSANDLCKLGLELVFQNWENDIFVNWKSQIRLSWHWGTFFRPRDMNRDEISMSLKASFHVPNPSFLGYTLKMLSKYHKCSLKNSPILLNVGIILKKKLSWIQEFQWRTKIYVDNFDTKLAFFFPSSFTSNIWEIFFYFFWVIEVSKFRSEFFLFLLENTLEMAKYGHNALLMLVINQIIR